jgi:hypothetical protein
LFQNLQKGGLIMIVAKQDFVTMGAVPCGEDCEQVGTSRYDPDKARFECGAYRRQLERLFPKGDFRVKSFPHDFGSYLEVVIVYDTEDEAETDLSFTVEGVCPEYWDEQSLKELREHGAVKGWDLSYLDKINRS